MRPNRKPAGQSGPLELWTLADHPPRPVLVKARFGAQSHAFCTHKGPAEGAKSCGSMIAPKRLPRASRRQCITKVCPRIFAGLPNT